MSLSSSHARCAGVLAIAALTAGGVTAGPANAKKLSAKQKSAIRAQLSKEIKKNPKAIRKASFIKRASLVNYTLPVTIRLRQATNNSGGTASNSGTTNTASIDLGPSLGTRQIGLGGSLPAEIKFKDSYDGGALGNVDLSLNPGGNGASGLTTSSIPLLANSAVAGADALSQAAGGCGDFTNASGAANLGPAGVDAIDLLTGSTDPGVNNLGSAQAILGGTDPQDVVLRTGALKLGIAPQGTTATVPGDAGNAQQITVGKSGGVANLFQNIPGRSTQIDVTANLATDINSILRQVDGATPPPPGNHAALFNCRQAWTGTVKNYLTGIHLNGSLRISPAITADGKLRIAKATLASPANDAAEIGLGACLVPFKSYAKTNPAYNPADPASSPIDQSDVNPAPSATCNSPANDAGSVIMRDVLGVQPLTAAASGAGYSTTQTGAQVDVMGTLKVNNISAEVLIGANQGGN